MARWFMAGAVFGAIVVVIGGAAVGIHAEPFTVDDTQAAIVRASSTTGVSESWLRRVVRCETGGTFRPDAVGDHGTSFGIAQLHRGGLLSAFYAEYDNPFDPYQAAEFMARQFLNGGAHYWSCR